MTAGKRQVSPPKAANAKKTKVQASPTKAPMDPLEVETAPVFELIQLSDLPTACKGMLKAAALPCLRTQKEQRHAYQEKIADVLSSVFTNTEAGKRAEVNQMEEQLAALGKECDEVKADADATAAHAKEAKEKADALGNLACEAQSLVESAKQASAAEKAKHGEIMSQSAQRATQKCDVEKVVHELFQPLEAAEIGGAHWRKRDKMIKELVEKLEPLEESLAFALPVALKEKPAQREEFANDAIKFASSLLANRIETLIQEKSDLDSQAAEQLKKESEAQAEVQNAEVALKARQEEQFEGENAWATAQTSANDKAAAVKAFQPSFQEMQQQLEVAKHGLASFSAGMEKFEKLKDHGAEHPVTTPEVVETADTMATEAVASGVLQTC